MSAWEGSVAQEHAEREAARRPPAAAKCNVFEEHLEPCGPNCVMAAKPKPGDKFDQGKARWDLLPFKALEEVVLVLTFDANKYTENGWRAVPHAKKRYLAAMWRHVVRWVAGEKRDPESGLHHLAHAACCALFLLELEIDHGQANP